jgi:hypothetical protein
MALGTTDPTQAADQMQASAQQPPPVANVAGMSGATMPQLPAPTAPKVTPAPPPKRTGLAGIVDEMRDALTGGTGGWGRVAAEAVTGAAAGYAAGRGAGNAGKAAFAGVQQGEHIDQMQAENQQRQQAEQQRQTENARQAKLDNFNFVKLQHDIAAGEFELTQRKVEATQNDVKFAQGQEDRQIALGSVDLGSYADLADFTKVKDQDPDFWKNTFGARVVAVPQLDPDGTRGGIHVFLQKPEAGAQQAPKDSTLWTFAPPGKGEKPELVPHTVTTPMTENELTARNFAMYKQYQDFVKTQADAEDKASQAKLRDEQTKTQGTEQTRNLAEARAADARAQATKSGAVLPSGEPNPRFEALAQALYDGDILPVDLKREAKGADLDPNEVMGRAVEIGQQKGQPWSETIINQEHKFAENTKTQAALDGINRILGKPGVTSGADAGYMNQMLDYAQKADLSSYGLYNSAELAVRRGLGDTAAKNFQTAVSETRRSISGLIGNPLLGGTESDMKLKQADEMLGQRPTLENLQGAAQVLRTALETQRQSIVGNNRFLQRRYGGQPQQVQPNAAPPGATNEVHQGDPGGPLIGHMVNGQYVPLVQPKVQ